MTLWLRFQEKKCRCLSGMSKCKVNRTSKRKERFPYLLTGVKPKWGSGIPTLIYLEEDGKGILITTPKKQLYFRSQQALVEGM